MINLTECPECEGTGGVFYDCSDCNGTGEGFRPESICPTCHGKGGKKEECPLCEGTGEIEEYGEDDSLDNEED